MGEGNGKLAIVLHSGSYDRVNYALSIATVAAAIGMEVHMLCTYGGFRRLVRGHTDELGDETDAAMRAAVEDGLRRQSIPLISEQLREAKRLGLKVYACVNAMATYNVARDELIEEVDKAMGLATFLELARDANTTIYV